MNSSFAAPRPADLFVATNRRPLVFHTPTLSPHPTTSYGQSRQDKGRPVPLSIFPSSPPVAIPLPAKSRFAATAAHVGGPPFAGYSSATGQTTTPEGSYAYTPATPSSPNTPSLLSSTVSPEVEMTDVFATPSSPTSRILPATSSLRLSAGNLVEAQQQQQQPLRGAVKLLVSKRFSSNAGLPSIQTAHLQCPTAPLTPPLTPPSYSNPHSLLPLVNPACTPSPSPHYSTLSARLLANYALHPQFASQYTIREELGAGGFGFVVRAARNVDGLSVAVKFIERAKIPSHGWVKSRSWGDAPGLAPMVEGYRLIPMEAFVLRSVRHKGVVAYIDLFEDEKYFYLIMEHHGSPWQSPDKAASTSPSDLPPVASQTMTPVSSPTFAPATPPTLSPPRAAPMERRSSCDLFECIEQHNRFNEATARYVFAQIVDVVASLGAVGICHRDLKDENIVISSDFKVKLIDFGSAVIFDPRKPAPLYNRFYGTLSSAAPEILNSQDYNVFQAEIWSLGVLLNILLTGTAPFANKDAAKRGERSTPNAGRGKLSREASDLLDACFVVDPQNRITLEAIRRHSWMQLR